MENEDLFSMFNNLKFTVDIQKYIDKYKKLINDMDKYMIVLERQINNEEDIILYFNLMAQRIYLEYQRESTQKILDCLLFNNN